ncbi:CD1375 family protein [Brevibacillus laterosporus]|uniref:CD1375 family protein n=1 Tax=Brevibacillus laterosporus TaxID=1465 RepID=A0AAP3DG87_BRELA|nr:CD1375 family protein [Brevibacillus laterosporus]MCR8980724.1 CD1375 family protein [Brevibacillus laterosporus]MCZ0807879.1 CD1375 family protein [Brevibacillus laterosporus]MCZ0826230.1 CD1375 family protein [Brevibacillus laterosporus]MCZ0851241.1 CD1375 family protein [Brevibacillus laterosporus]
MVKQYMIPVYAFLVKSGEWAIEPVENVKKILPEAYRMPVAEFLADQSNKK